MDVEERQGTDWLRDFLLTWVTRLGFFFSFHQMQPLFPLYLGEMGASSTVIGAVSAAFTITATITRPPVGLLIDRHGRKPFLLSGIALFGVSVLGYLWAPSILLITLCRVLHGIGWSGCTTAVSTLAVDIAPEKRRGELIGYAGMASNLGAALGPITGFALFYRYGYAGLFLSSFAIVVLSLLVACWIHEPELSAAPLPERKGWIEAISVPESLLPAITVAFLSFCHGGILTFLPFYALKQGLQNPGVWFAVYATSLLLSRPIAGPLSDRFGRRVVILPGFILNLAGVVLLALAPTPLWLIVAAVIMGFGFGSAHPSLTALLVDRTSPQRRGLSIAQFQLFFDLGIGVGAVALGTLLDLTEQNFSAMYLVTAAIGSVGLIIYWLRG